MDKIVERVKDKLTKRSERGVSKYGTTLDENVLPTKDWLVHLQEEMMDGSNYIEKLLDMLSFEDKIKIPCILDIPPKGIVLAYKDGHIHEGIFKDDWSLYTGSSLIKDIEKYIVKSTLFQ